MRKIRMRVHHHNIKPRKVEQKQGTEKLRDRDRVPVKKKPKR